MYKVFFRMLVGTQLAADELRDQGRDDSALRNYFQRALRLNDFERLALVSAARDCVAELDQQGRVIQELARELKSRPDNAEARAKLAGLQGKGEAAVTGAVEQLRQSLGPERFAQVDMLIRLRVRQNLRLAPGRSGQPARRGGN